MPVSLGVLFQAAPVPPVHLHQSRIIDPYVDTASPVANAHKPFLPHSHTLWGKLTLPMGTRVPFIKWLVIKCKEKIFFAFFFYDDATLLQQYETISICKGTLRIYHSFPCQRLTPSLHWVSEEGKSRVASGGQHHSVVHFSLLLNTYPPPPLQTPGLARDGLPGGGGRRSPSDGLPGGGGGDCKGYFKANCGTLH